MTEHIISTSCCCYLIMKSCPTLLQPMDCSTPGSSVLAYLQEFARIHVHWVSDYLITSSSATPFSICFSLPQHQGLFNESALSITWPKCWPFSLSNSPSCEYSGLISLGLTDLISLQSKGLSRVLSKTTVRRQQIFGAQPSLWSNSHIQT